MGKRMAAIWKAGQDSEQRRRRGLRILSRFRVETKVRSEGYELPGESGRGGDVKCRDQAGTGRGSKRRAAGSA